MRKHIFFIFIFSIFLQFTLSAADTGKTRLAILPFSSNGNIDKDIADVMFENFTIAMVDAGIYSIVERRQLDKVLNELKFQRGDVFDNSSAIQLGKMAGAQMVIFGSINYAANVYYFNIKGIDVTTGVVSFGKREETRNINELVNMADKLAEAISGSGSKKESKLSSKGELTIGDIEFIEKYYKNKWKIATYDRDENKRKFNQFIGGGIGLSVGGSTLFLGGIIFEVVMGVIQEGSYMVVATPFMSIGAIMTSLCSIFFYFADRVKKIYRRTTGEKLVFWDRANFGIGFTMKENGFTKEQESRLNLSMSISL